MEVENMSSTVTSMMKVEEDEDARLPGFRFHPTDEEVVGFYLRRKVEKRPISIELIKQADIYKYDPWDLPKSNTVGDKEWYFYCKRGRKYKNSIRPNRVTGSGFWKATGIDKPIYSSSSNSSKECIGLKKSLVYYRGSAGKGTKTDWMMHEFRLPTTNDKSTKHMDAKTIAQEAEVWTLCRILKRDVSYKKCIPADWREKRTNNRVVEASSETCSVEESCDQNGQSSYISFSAPHVTTHVDKRSEANYNYVQSSSSSSSFANQHDQFVGHYQAAPTYFCGDINELLRHADWEDLRSIVDCGMTTTTNPSCLYL